MLSKAYPGNISFKKALDLAPGTWLHTLLLISAISLAFYMALLPKLPYQYPLHVDEWLHLDEAKRILYQGGLPTPIHREAGFHVLLAEISVITGLDWYSIFRWFPAILYATTVLLTYLLGRRFGCGLESAFFATLVPTTIRALGPAFLVPVSLGMLALPLLMYIVLSLPETKVRGAVLAAVVFAFIWVVHPGSAILLTLLMVVCSLLMVTTKSDETLIQRLRRVLIVAGLAAIPVIGFLLWRHDLVSRTLGSLEGLRGSDTLPPIANLGLEMGSVTIAFFIFGTFYLLFKGGREEFSLVGSAAVMIGLIFLYYRTHIGVQTLADRVWLHLALMVGFIAGFGASTIRSWNPMKSSHGMRNGFTLAASLAVFIMVTIAVVTGYQRNKSELYYQLVDDRTASDFQWIDENLDPKKRLTVLRTDMAIAYSAVTQGRVYATEAFPFTNQTGQEAMRFLFAESSGPPSDMDWMITTKEVGLVYAPNWYDGGTLFDQLRPGIFVPTKITTR